MDGATPGNQLRIFIQKTEKTTAESRMCEGTEEFKNLCPWTSEHDHR